LRKEESQCFSDIPGAPLLLLKDQMRTIRFTGRGLRPRTSQEHPDAFYTGFIPEELCPAPFQLNQLKARWIFCARPVNLFVVNHHGLDPEHLALTRREFLCRCGMGMGALSLASLFGNLGFLNSVGAAEGFNSPLAPRQPHFAAKAKRIIHIFANGGPSHVDTFDPKPALDKYDEKPMPDDKVILLVEDNHTNARMAEAVLEDAGYQVLVAENAEEALSLAQTHRPGLVLMDIHLPGIDGLTGLQQLRSDPQTRAAKVIAVTAMAMKGDRERFLAAGFDGYVSKPFKREELLEAVKAVLTQ